MGSALGDVSAKLQTVISDLGKYEELLSESRMKLANLDKAVQAALDGSSSGRQRPIAGYLASATTGVRRATESVQEAKKAAAGYISGAGAPAAGAASPAAWAQAGVGTAAVAAAPTSASDTDADADADQAEPAPAEPAPDAGASASTEAPGLMEKVFRRIDLVEKKLGLRTEKETQDLIKEREFLKLYKSNPNKPFHPKSWAPLANDAVRGYILSNLHTHESLHKLHVDFCRSELQKLQSGTSNLSAEDLAGHEAKVQGWLTEFEKLIGIPGQPLPEGSLNQLLALSAEVQHAFPAKRQRVSIADLVLQADPGMAAIYVGKLTTMAVSAGLTLAGAPLAAIPFKFAAGSLSRIATEAYKHSHSGLSRASPPPLANLLRRAFVMQALTQAGMFALPFVQPAAHRVFEWTVQSVLTRRVP